MTNGVLEFTTSFMATADPPPVHDRTAVVCVMFVIDILVISAKDNVVTLEVVVDAPVTP